MKLILFSFLLFASSLTYSLELPHVGNFQIKNISDKNILYIQHTHDKGHISNSLIKLIQYYLLNDTDNYQVVFPQLSIESDTIDGQYYAIGYTGIPQETTEIKTTTLKGGVFASYVYKGNYKYIGKAIRSTFKKILQTDNYIPDDNEEIRLLYWNSVDDNLPKDLITEIQIKVKQRK